MKFLTKQGLQRFLDRLKAIIPTKTSDITNDSGYLDTTGVQNYMENGGGYSQSYIDTALSGKSDTGHTHTKSEITDFPSLATVSTSGDYTDLSNKPSINDATLTIQKNSTNVATFTANASSNVTANITVPTAVSELTNDSGYLTASSSLDSSKLTGTIDIARLPKGALERLVTVANQTARYALTVNDVQLGDTVKQLDTGVMYIVVDESKLSSSDGYTEYTAGSATSVPWSGITGKPSDFTPSSHTHGSITNDGKLGTASRALISDSSKNITVSSVSDTELGYLSGVTSAIQTQIDGKANDSSVVHKTGNEDISGTKTFKNSTSVDVNIQKGTSSGSCNIRFNDDTGLSRTVIRSYNDKLEIGHLRNANWYDGAEIVLIDNGSSKIKSNNGTVSTEVSFNPDSVKPTNSAIDLGTSTNKWKSVYSDAYYLGTTAFGDIATHNTSEFSASTHVHGNITNDGKVGTTANKPLITGTGGVVQAGSFGTSANTFCEGNDSRLSDARTPVAHTHVTSEVLKTGSAITGNPQTNFFFKIASWEMGANQYFGAELLVQNSNYTQNRATVTISVRTSSSYTLAAGYLYLSNDLGFNLEQFYICYKEESNKVLFELYHYMPSTWNGIKFSVISECLNKGSLAIELFNTMTVYNRISSDAVADLPTGYTVIEAKYLPLSQDINPSSNNTRDLGTSSYKWRKVYSDDVVHTSGDESVSGTKSFNSDLNLNYASTDVDDIVNSVAGSSVLDNFVHMSGDETVNGIKSFPDGIVANITGSATSATNDGSGNVISSTYGKLGTVNTWTADQICTSSFYIQHPTMETSVIPSNTKLSTYYFSDKNGSGIGGIRRYFHDTGDQQMQIFGATKIKNGQLDPTGSTVWFGFSETCKPNGDRHFSFDGYMASSLNPYYSNQVIGTSSNMWSDIWTGNTNTKYLGLHTTLKTKGVAPSGSGRNNTSIAFRDTNYNLLGKIEHNCYSSGVSFLEFSVENNYTNGALDPNGSNVSNSLQLYLGRTGDRSFCPGYDNEVYLGASNRQWKSVFAQTYYYNGTQWGLDQANVWSVAQTIRGQYPDLACQSTNLMMGSNTSVGGCAVRCQDTAGNSLAFVSMRVNAAARTIIELCTRNTYKNGVLSNDQDAEVISSSFIFGQLWNGTPYYQLSGGTLNDIYPMNLNGTNQNLGTSSYKWKTLNGLNPGSLSIPDPDSSDVDLIDTGAGSGWDLTGTSINSYTADFDGWLCLSCADVAGDFLFASYGNPAIRTSVSGTGQITNANVGRGLCLYLPVKSGNTVSCLTKASSNFYASFIPCLGNV